MPKIKINIINGKPATPGISLGNRQILVPEGAALETYDSKEAGVTLMTTADVDDIGPWQALLDRGVIVTIAGRPKAT